jgi:hypothetical protein
MPGRGSSDHCSLNCDRRLRRVSPMPEPISSSATSRQVPTLISIGLRRRAQSHDCIFAPRRSRLEKRPYIGDKSSVPVPGIRLCRCGLHRPQYVLLPGEEIVDLQQIESRHAPESSGGFDLVRPAGTGGDPDLVGREQAWRPIELGETVTNHLLGRAVHARGIDQASAGIEEGAVALNKRRLSATRSRTAFFPKTKKVHRKNRKVLYGDRDIRTHEGLKTSRSLALNYLERHFGKQEAHRYR